MGISVITITFNDIKGFAKTANSVPDELVDWIVIDGSTDPEAKRSTKELLKGRHVNLIQEIDTGRFNAMNKGLKLANEEIVIFLNGGDAFADKKVPTDIVADFKQSDWLWQVGQTQVIGENGDVLWKWPFPKHNSLKLKLGVNSYCHQATVVQKKLLLDLGGFLEDSLYSDWGVSLALSRLAAPNRTENLWINFLANGISSRQTLEYWEKESSRVRRHYNVTLFKSNTFDAFFQKLAKSFLLTKRGQLIRPDMERKHK
jgi:glycosyltransferase involved in cell wall biosynthesis